MSRIEGQDFQTQGVTVQQIELEIPTQKIKDIDAEIRDITFEIINDKIIIQGIIHKQIFFVGTDNVVHHQTEEMPFSTFIDVPGAEPGMDAQIHPEIEHVAFELSPDGTELNQKVVVEIFVKITETVQVNIEETTEGSLYKLETVIGENNKQEIVENEVELDIPAIKIVDITAEIRDLETDVIQDKVIIQGVLHKQIFFIGEDNVEYHQAENVPFSLFVDIPGAEPGMNVQVHPDIELIKRELIDSTTLLQEVIIDFFVKVTETQQLNLTIGEGPLMKLDRVIGEDIVQVMKVNDITLERPAMKIRDIEATLRDIQAVVITDKVIVQGTIHKQIFYVGTDDVEYHQAEDVNFSTFVDLPGAAPGMDVTIKGVVELARGTLTDQTTLHQKVVAELAVKVTEEEQVNIVIGNGPLIKARQVVNEGVRQIIVEQVAVFPPVPPPVAGLVIDRALIKEEVAEEVSEQILVDNVIDLEDQAQKVRSITGTIRNVTVEIVDGEVLVEGEIVKEIEFVDSDNVVRQMTEVVPFEALIEFPDVPEGAELNADIVIEDINFNLINNCTAIRQIVVLQITVTAGESRQVQVVTNISATGGGTVEVETVEVRAQVVVGEDTITPTLENTVELDPAADEIIDMTGELQDITTEVMEDQVVVNGTVFKEVEYLDVDDTIQNTFEEIPFEFTIDIEGAAPGMNVQVHPEILDIAFELSEDGTELLQMIDLEIFVKVTEMEIIEVVTDATSDLIEELITEIVFLDVVGDGIPEPVPVEVVVDVIGT